MKAKHPHATREETAPLYDATPDTEAATLAAAEAILQRRLVRLAALKSPADTVAFLRARLAHLDVEQFTAVWLDGQHRVLACETLFTGTLNSTAVYPREVVRAALRHNAGAVVLAHNHPSGVPEPSPADRSITAELKRALELIGCRVLDHIVIGLEGHVSLAERGYV